MARATAPLAHRGTISSSLLTLSLLASTAAAQQQAQTCVYIGGSTACPAYNTSYISTDATLVGYFPFLANVTDTASFDSNLFAYATNGYVTSKYQNTFGCTNINPSNTTNIYARYTISFICNAIVQNSLQPCNVAQDAYPPICASSCADFAQSEAEIVDSAQLCGTANANAVDLLRADFTNCALPADSISGSCILASVNEPDNCGFQDNLSGLCNYCAGSTLNSTDSCCVTSQTESRCTNVRLPVYGSSQPGLTAPVPTATGNANATASAAAESYSTSGLSGGQIAGIVVGSVIGGLVLLALLIFGCLMFRRRQSSHNEKASFLNQPTPPRSGGTMASRRSGPETKFEPVPNARVTRMTALEGPTNDSPSSTDETQSPAERAPAAFDGASMGTMGVMGAAGIASIPMREKSGAKTPPRDGHDMTSSTDPSPQETDSSPEGGNMRSEQMDAFKDYYSQDDIHPGDLVSTLWAYQPRAGDEFELERGDMLKIVGIWDDGWATGIRVNGRAEDWDPDRDFTRDSGFSNNEPTNDSPPTGGNVKAFPHWSKTVDGEREGGEEDEDDAAPGDEAGEPPA